MENTNINLKNIWRIVAIILAIFTVFLAGTTMWFAIQSNKKDNATVQKDKNESSEGEKTDNQKDLVSTESNAQYLTVSKWGVHFPIPDAFSKLEYSISDNRLDFKGILPSIPSWELDGGFSFDSAKDEILYVVHQPRDNDPFAGCTTSCPTLATSVNGYNLYLGHRQNGIYDSLVEENYAGVAIYLLELMVINAEAI